MLKAIARAKDGRAILVLGITGGNVQRMKEGKPIYFDLDALHVSPADRLGHVTVFYGETEAALHDTIKGLLGPNTEIIAVPQSPKTPQ
jgi:hypothetical protein